MPRTVDKTLIDLDATDAARIRMGKVIYVPAFYQSLYDDALGRVSADLGKSLPTLSLLVQPTDAIRKLLHNKSGALDR